MYLLNEKFYKTDSWGQFLKKWEVERNVGSSFLGSMKPSQIFLILWI